MLEEDRFGRDPRSISYSSPDAKRDGLHIISPRLSWMKVLLEIVFSVAFVGAFGFVAVLRWGLAFPRLGRWLDRKLGTDWFDDGRPTDKLQP